MPNGMRSCAQGARRVVVATLQAVMAFCHKKLGSLNKRVPAQSPAPKLKAWGKRQYLPLAACHLFLLCLFYSHLGNATPVSDPTIDQYSCNGTDSIPPKLGFHQTGYGQYFGSPAVFFVTRSVVPPGTGLGPEGQALVSAGWAIVNNCVFPRSYWDQYIVDGYFPSLYMRRMPDPKNIGSGCGMTGNPINTATGNKYLPEVDYIDSA